MKCLRIFLLLIGLSASASPAYAHFPWVTISEEGKVTYFFGENPADRTYKLPGPIAKCDVELVSPKGTKQKVTLHSVETDDFVGRQSSENVDANATLQSQVTFGIYHGSRLEYYTVHVGGKLPTSREDAAQTAPQQDLKTLLVDTDNGVDAYVLWKGKPLADTEVHLFCEEGHEEASAKTDQNGKVTFTDKQVEDGLNGIMVGHTVQDEKGSIGDQKYDSASHYLTVTFHDPEETEK
ncbi:hypothetical protein [Blastopirellula marina]|uniref:DUF4198 domain-containing protein n=1 Tax=Blastopirellula marina TaxID=124 RepID=A0A2S8F9L9_9BACT|nr:hypothetical protein [Blastopirellula marina]PQO28830.1 hypothetical protein C5Y98_23990 [Blastopirellula marina]PTL42103.1 hypothetical protein C5Y97_24005 [Blastopirellula marina]